MLEKLKEYQHRKELYVQLMGQLVEEAVPPSGWDGKDCNIYPSGSGSGSSSSTSDSSRSSGDSSQPNDSTRTSGATTGRGSRNVDGESSTNFGGDIGYCLGSPDQPLGFPFYDNMIDLQFNVRSQDRERARQSCVEKQQKS